MRPPLLLLLSSPLLAQTDLFDKGGDSAGDRFGASVTFAGDVNADGHTDFLIGAPGDDDGGSEAGRVSLISGATGQVLWRRDGSAGQRLGSSVAGGQDVNADGVSDVVVGAPVGGAAGGRALVLSGTDGAQLFSLAAQSQSDYPNAVALLADVNGDGHAEVAVARMTSGLQVFSGIDGSSLWISNQTVHTVAPLGDVTADGVGEVLVGNPTHGSLVMGRSWVLDGTTGAVKTAHTHDGSGGGEYDYFGTGLGNVGDVNLDGVDDYAVGAPHFPPLHPWNECYVEVFSGLDGSKLQKIESGFDNDFGTSLAGVGDLTGDGLPDLVIGRPGFPFGSTDDGSVELHDGQSGGLVGRFSSSSGIGSSLGGGGDVNQDGIPDLVAGNPDDDGNGQDAGRVRIWSLTCPTGMAWSYCAAGPAQTGYQNSLSLSTNNLRLVASGCEANKFGLFFFGSTPTQQIVPGCCYICIASPQYRLGVINTGAQGLASFQVDNSNLPGNVTWQPGERWHFQFWYRSANSHGYTFSRALCLRFCP